MQQVLNFWWGSWCLWTQTPDGGVSMSPALLAPAQISPANTPFPGRIWAPDTFIFSGICENTRGGFWHSITRQAQLSCSGVPCVSVGSQFGPVGLNLDRYHNVVFDLDWWPYVTQRFECCRSALSPSSSCFVAFTLGVSRPVRMTEEGDEPSALFQVDHVALLHTSGPPPHICQHMSPQCVHARGVFQSFRLHSNA